MHRLYREEYADFTVKHFHEDLSQRHGDHLGYTVTRLSLQSAGLVKPAPERGKHRKKRPRRPLPGMLLFQDGSMHRWIGALGHDLNLIVTLDDATSQITSAFLIEEEGTMSSFVGLSETIEAYGLLGALYTDRGSHYFYTPAAGEKVDKTHPTQVGRALAQLGIRHIPSYSPEARGADGTGVRYVEATPGLGSDAAFDFAGFNGRALADRDGWCHRRYSVHADLGGCGSALDARGNVGDPACGTGMAIHPAAQVGGYRRVVTWSDRPARRAAPGHDAARATSCSGCSQAREESVGGVPDNGRRTTEAGSSRPMYSGSSVTPPVDSANEITIGRVSASCSGTGVIPLRSSQTSMTSRRAGE